MHAFYGEDPIILRRKLKKTSFQTNLPGRIGKVPQMKQLKSGAKYEKFKELGKKILAYEDTYHLSIDIGVLADGSLTVFEYQSQAQYHAAPMRDVVTRLADSILNMYEDKCAAGHQEEQETDEA